jgi:hypothetical protein
MNMLEVVWRKELECSIIKANQGAADAVLMRNPPPSLPLAAAAVL